MNQVEARARRDVDILRDELSTMAGQFAMALPAQIPVERFVRVGMTAIQSNEELLRCDRKTLWRAFMKAAEDGLLPDGKEGAIVAYNTKVKTGGQERYVLTAQWIPMIAGIRKKVRNSGLLIDWHIEPVFQKDAFEAELGDNPHILHRPAIFEKDRGPLLGFYSIAFLKDGISRELMSIHDVERIRQLSKAPDSPAWKNHLIEMGKKTIAKRHAKSLPMSTDLDDLLRRDDEIHGSADIPAQIGREIPRPQLEDFSEQSPPADETAVSGDEKAGKDQTKAGQKKPTSDERTNKNGTNEAGQVPHDPQTGEIKEPATPGANKPQEIGPPEAMEMGRQARDRNHALKAVPPEWRTPEMAPMADAWSDGWRARDKEIEDAKAKR